MESSLRHILHSSNHPLPTLVDHSPPSNTNGDADATVANASKKRPASRVKSSYPRKRAIHACRNCRIRRTKCDNERPACSSCLDLGAECIYSDADPSTFDSASLAILERLNTLEELLRASNAGTGVVAVEEADDPQASLLLLKSLGSPSLERTRESFPTHINIEAVLSWPVFEGRDFDRRVDLKGLLQANNEDSLRSNKYVVEDFDHCDGEALLQRFLDHVYIFNPILEEAQVQKYMRDARFNGLGWDVQSCLLLLIYAHGSITIPFDGDPGSDSCAFRQSNEFKQAESFFFAAQKRMGLLLCKSGVVEAQCFFLAGVYLMATIRPIEAWKMFVQALACCQGFYSEKRVPEPQNESEQRLQESIYWTCFKSELELRLELNVSEKSVWDLTYPAFFPSPPEGLKTQGEIVWYFYLAEIALRRLGNRILNYIYKCQPSVSPHLIADSIPSFEHQADGWIRSLPTALHLDSTDGEEGEEAENPLHATLKFILNGHLLDCYEMMYWPFVVDSINSHYTHSRPHPSQNSSITDSFARKGLLVCVQRIQKNERGFFHRHHGTWLMLRSCTRSALVLLGARNSARLAGLVPRGWEDAVWKVCGMLRFWAVESRDCRDRLAILEELMDGVGA